MARSFTSFLRKNYRQLDTIAFLVIPAMMFLLRPSFILIPVVISTIAWMFFSIKRERRQSFNIVAYTIAYIAIVGCYAIVNSSRTGVVRISNTSNHNIFANLMAVGILEYEATKEQPSPEVKSFYDSYKSLSPELQTSQYSLFKAWRAVHPEASQLTFDKTLAKVNADLLKDHKIDYLKITISNLDTVIQGTTANKYFPASENLSENSWQYLIVTKWRDLTELQYFIIKNLFFASVALFFIGILIRIIDPFFACLIAAIFVQFSTISFFGYGEFRRQAICMLPMQIYSIYAAFAFVGSKICIMKLSRKGLR